MFDEREGRRRRGRERVDHTDCNDAWETKRALHLLLEEEGEKEEKLNEVVEEKEEKMVEEVAKV